MKVIDLLNKIAKDKKIPKRIKHKGVIYKYQQEARNYAYKGANSYYCWFLSETIADVTFLNDEVEIIEEDEEIDIGSIEEISIRPYKGFVDTCNYLERKGNELIKAVKQLNKTKEDKVK